MTIKFQIHTLGCKVNQYDSSVLSQALLKNGFVLSLEKPDLIIINSCVVTKVAITKARQLLQRMKRENPKSKILLMGWFPKVYEEAKKLPAHVFWGVGDLENLVLMLKTEFGLSGTFCRPDLLSETDRARYLIKIQEGCNQFCSYCVIPYARGRLKSRSSQEIINEIKKAIEHGYAEIVLVGTHIGLYGRESDNLEKINLVGLLQKIFLLKGLGRIRLSSIEITELTDELISLLKKEKRFCPHFHVSLQSGCDKILRAMNRPYTTQYFKDRVEAIRQVNPRAAITTDIIVGFPGETEADFLETYNFAKEINFSKIHVFSFSAHEKTPAFNLPNQVSRIEIKKRSEKLRVLSAQLEKKYYDSFKGETIEIVVENTVGSDVVGKSQYYFTVKQKKEDRNIIIGQIIKVKL
jgi:threonylcarbamoyladenosine tRNA methylthiotransferase MtaB